MELVFVLVLVAGFTLLRNIPGEPWEMATRAILNTSVANPGTARRE